jgi:plasmid stabilization system protein ParE
MTYTVAFSGPAEDDLFAIYDYITERAGAAIALRFVESIEAYCIGFATMPERGTRRNDLRAGLRTVGFRRRATILFEVDRTAQRVVIHGVYYAGRNWGDDDIAGGDIEAE